MSRVREKAANFINRVPKSGLSSLANPKEFDALVGPAPKNKDDPSGKFHSRQEQMEATNFKMTFCNEFAGECARSSVGTYLGALDLKSFVLGSKRPYAWVEADSGREPKLGDILYFFGAHRHLGVAVGVNGAKLSKVEAGQGGAIARQDFIKWTESAWPSADLVGWVDLDLWEYGPDYEDSQPDIGGDWTVWGDKRRYRWKYTFNTNDASVRWRDVFNGMTGLGTWKFSDGKLRIQWQSGSTDIWDTPIDFTGTKGIEDMKGEGVMDIFATKP